MHYFRNINAALGMLTLAAATLVGCASSSQVAEYNDSFAPSIVNPRAYDILIASATYRDPTGLALGAGDHFGSVVHEEYVFTVRTQIRSDIFADVGGSGHIED